ncbi:GNAT family N-acetyltransferase [Actinoplanes sp. NPDC026619]|uniref:GNAT family N-acetyltransferase n=1 Tax=Actinoplanes sp. NPDC026619 TaxID=3155798 RepID=UPI0033C9D07D
MTLADQTISEYEVPVIRRADDGDYQNVTMLLVSAFFYGDLAGHLIPKVTDRASRYFPYFEIIAEHALANAHVDLIMDKTAAMPAAAAIWHTVGDGGFHFDLADYDARLADAVGPALARFVALDAAMHRHHPTKPDHDYLAFLGVQPGWQGKGLGSRLLRHRHDRLDHAGRHAYLEATGDRNRRLYERHGYLALEPFDVAPDGPPLHPMWRPPRG